MTKAAGTLGGLRSFWQGYVDVRPAERRRAWVGGLTLFGLVVTHELLETSRHALFLQRLSPEQLPYAYLALAGAAVLWSVAARWVGTRVRPPRLASMLGASCVGIALLWYFQAHGGSIYPYVLYLSTSLVVPVWMVAFWIRQSSLWTVLEAKRIFAFFALGGLAGNVAGAALSGALANQYGVRSLLVAACAVLVLTTLTGARRIDAAPVVIAPQHREDEEEDERAVPGRYVPLLMVMGVLGAVATKLGEFLFLRGVSYRVHSEDLASTLAAASLLSSLGAIVVHIAFARWALRTVGVTRSIAILPTLYAVVASWSALGSSYHAPMVLRITDGALRQPVYRTAMELLFLPLPPRIRQTAKTWVDIAGQRAGQAIASIAILAMASWGSGDHRIIAAVTVVVSMLWAASSPLLQRDYVDLFRKTLGRGMERANAVPSELEHGSVVALLASLDDRDPKTVVAALDMLVQAGANHLLPASLLAHASKDVVMRALESGPESSRPWTRAAHRLLEHEDPDVRAAALRWIGAPDAARRLLGDRDVRVRVTAFVIASAESNEQANERELCVFAEGDTETQLALLSAVSAQATPAPHLVGTLQRLAREGTPPVQEAVAHLAVRHPLPELLPELIDMVAHASTRGPARDAIVRYGQDALDPLCARLEDPITPAVLRRHLPGTIARIGGKRAAHVLLERYGTEPDERVRSKLLRALLTLRSRDPSIPIDGALLSHCIDRTLARGAQLTRWATQLYGFLEGAPAYTTPATERLLDALYEERTRSLERALCLLELLHRGDDYATVRRNALQGDVGKRAQAIELLGNIAPAELRSRLFALCTDEARLAPDPTDIFAPKSSEMRAYRTLLGEMRAHGSEAIRLLANRARDEHPAMPPSTRTRTLGNGEGGSIPMAETVLWLRKVPLFAQVDPRSLGLIAAHTEDRRYPAEAALSGRPSESALVIVLSGLVELADRTRCEPGCVLDTTQLFSDEPGPIAVARTEVHVLELRASTLVDLMREHFDLFMAIAKQLASEALARIPQRGSNSHGAPFDQDGIVERMDVLGAALPFFAGHASSCAQLANACSREERGPGESLFIPEPVCRSVALVTHGEVIDTARPGEIAPGGHCGLLEALLELAPPRANAVGPVEALFLSSDDLLDALEEHASLQRSFLHFLSCYGRRPRRASSDIAA
ncbi:MAG: hypothetical protein HOW73_04700 [Polyangiaceae bacterium]|nr:hypothetical protein [Polyangiaceae bacterium]